MYLIRKAVLSFLTLFALLSVSPPIFADEVPNQEKKCRTQEVFSLSLQYQSTLNKDTDLGLFFKNKVSAIQEIAKKHKLKKCKIVSQDMSMSPNAYENDKIEVSVSLSIETSLDYKAINHLYLESKAYAASVNRYETEVCDDD